MENNNVIPKTQIQIKKIPVPVPVPVPVVSKLPKNESSNFITSQLNQNKSENIDNSMKHYMISSKYSSSFIIPSSATSVTFTIEPTDQPLLLSLTVLNSEPILLPTYSQLPINLQSSVPDKIPVP